MSTTDAQLIKRYQQGENDALSELIERYRPRIKAIVCYRVPNLSPHHHDDIVADVEFRIFKSIHKYRDNNFLGWLSFLIRSAIIENYNYNRRNSNSGLDFQIVCTDETLDAAMAGADEQNGRIREAILHLPDKYRRAVSAYYFGQENSTNKMAEQEGVSKSTFCNWVKRGREKLREYLTDGCPGQIPEMPQFEFRLDPKRERILRRETSSWTADEITTLIT